MRGCWPWAWVAWGLLGLGTRGGALECERQSSAEGAADTEVCGREAGKQTTCFAVWTNGSDGAPKLLRKGCWHPELDNREPCAQGPVCQAFQQRDIQQSAHYFCCCASDGCNGRLELALEEEEAEAEVAERPQWLTAALILGSLLLSALLLLLLFWLLRRRQFQRRQAKAEEARANGSPGSHWKLAPLSGSASLSHAPIQLSHVIARGRYGQVWEARLRDAPVAVKVFPAQDVDSWMQEQDIYALEGMRSHANILAFLGAEEWGGSGQEGEYWLVSELHRHGSLSDYLKTHTLSEEEGMSLILTMLRGLAFLHEELEGGRPGVPKKPCAVHRDLKSKNVLVKGDMTACLGDFGLGMRCSGGRSAEETHGQVGTRRYMAPEVLEGATEFTAFAFRQIDVYAAALVIWETLSRTRSPAQAPEAYKLPFEEEAGAHPSLADMQALVVQGKRRPVLGPHWAPTHGLLLSTVEEMWDTEPDARITASCALERLVPLAPASLRPRALLVDYTSLRPFPDPQAAPALPAADAAPSLPSLPADRAPLLPASAHLPPSSQQNNHQPLV